MATQLLYSTPEVRQGQPVQMAHGSPNRTYSASVTGTGEVSATVIIYGSNDNRAWRDLGTITLSGTTSDSDGFPSVAPWNWIRADVTAISGTNATVNASVGY